MPCWLLDISFRLCHVLSGGVFLFFWCFELKRSIWSSPRVSSYTWRPPAGTRFLPEARLKWHRWSSWTTPTRWVWHTNLLSSAECEPNLSFRWSQSSLFISHAASSNLLFRQLICGWYHPLNPSSPPLQVNLKMRVRLSYSRQGSAFQDTVQIDSFPGLSGAGHWRRPRSLFVCRRAHRLRLSLTDDSHSALQPRLLSL